MVKDLIYCLDITFSFVLSIDEDIIQIHNDKDIKLFCKDFIDIVLECCQNIGQSKRYYLILEVIVSGPESSFLLILFTNSYMVIGTDEIEFDKLPSPP